MTVITPGGSSIASTVTVSIAGAGGCFTCSTSLRAGFFSVARLGLALATAGFVAFPLADFDTLRALLRVFEFPLRSFARFCTFDHFLRLAMIDPLLVVSDQRTIRKVPATHLTSYQQIAFSATTRTLCFVGRIRPFVPRSPSSHPLSGHVSASLTILWHCPAAKACLPAAC
jgi:hypothetical protein